MRLLLSVCMVGILGVCTIGCSGDTKKASSTTERDAGPAPAWASQAYDVQSTWNNTNEPKLTKKNIGKLVELWSQPLGLTSTVTVVDKRVYTSASSGIAAVNADDGRPLWRQSGTAEAPIGTTAAPTYENGVLYIDNASRGYVYALDANTGNVIWGTQIETHPQSAGYSVPIIYKDKIFLGVSSDEEVGTTKNATFRGSVVALDKKTGSMAWKTYTVGDNENGAAVWSTVAIDPNNNTVYATTGNNYTGDPGSGSDSIFALDTETGHINWHVQVDTGDVYTINNVRSGDTDFGANPVVFDYQGQHLVAAGQKSGDLYVLNRDDGTMVAHRSLGAGSSYIGGIFQALAWDGIYLYTVCNMVTSDAPGSEPSNGDSGSPSTLFALNPTTLDIIWERQLPAWVWDPMTLANGMGFLGAETHFEVFDTSGGAKLFDYQAKGTIIGAPVVNDGRIYFASGLSYFFGHPDDKLHVFGLPDDPAKGMHYDAAPPDLSAPTFANVYAAVIAKSCIDSQCHGASMQGNLNMQGGITAYTDLVNVPAGGTCPGPDGSTEDSCACGKSGKIRVVPGHPEQSLLIEKLSGNPSCGDRMPPNAEPLSQDLQDLVKNWILAGAGGH
ncbi:MAG TPA: PQQ-binding-like beta-propeller repeat protein [Polyangiaceae bacterium]|nr:PQQ-binding-like beta-propeller repeat protein [Polyangiaceae bacterium]